MIFDLSMQKPEPRNYVPLFDCTLELAPDIFSASSRDKPQVPKISSRCSKCTFWLLWSTVPSPAKKNQALYFSEFSHRESVFVIGIRAPVQHRFYAVGKSTWNLQKLPQYLFRNSVACSRGTTVSSVYLLNPDWIQRSLNYSDSTGLIPLNLYHPLAPVKPHQTAPFFL